MSKKNQFQIMDKKNFFEKVGKGKYFGWDFERHDGLIKQIDWVWHIRGTRVAIDTTRDPQIPQWIRFNHGKGSKKNCEFHFNYDTGIMCIVATKSIKPNDQLFVHYSESAKDIPSHWE